MSRTKRDLDSVEDYERQQQERGDESARFDDQYIPMEPGQFIAALERAFSRMEAEQ